MWRILSLALALMAAPARAEGPNLSAAPQGTPGSASQLVLAERAFAAALASGDILPLLAAIRLAREVTLRPATGWAREAPATAEVGLISPPPATDPAGEAALIIARNLAGDDPDLRDLVFDLDAQVPRGPGPTAVEARALLAPDQTDRWRVPLFGEVAAEIAVIGDGRTALGLTVLDESGATVCARPASPMPQLCRLTPARNGFFVVEIRNAGATPASYRLIGN
jgi:hypothetical protein